MRTVLRRPIAVDQALPPLLLVAREPLVADATTDAVPSAELAHLEAIALGVADETETFFHGNTLLPRHHHLAHWRLVMQVSRSVTHVPGLHCYLCTRTIPTCRITNAEADERS